MYIIKGQNPIIFIDHVKSHMILKYSFLSHIVKQGQKVVHKNVS